MELWWLLFWASFGLDNVAMLIAGQLSSGVLNMAYGWRAIPLQKDDVPKELRTADAAAVAAAVGVGFAIVTMCIAIDIPLLHSPIVLVAVAILFGVSVIPLIITLFLRWKLRDIAATLTDDETYTADNSPTLVSTKKRTNDKV